MKKDNKYEDIEQGQEKVISLITLILVFVVGLFIYKTYNTNFFADPAHWGIFGDYVGGTLNPILGFFSFMLLLLNLYLQRKQLDKTEEQLELNREELKLTRDELKKAADAQTDSAKVMNEQLKTQFLQQFDSLFFSLLEKLNKKLEELERDKVLDDFCESMKQPFIPSSLENHRKQLQLLDLIFEILNILEVRFLNTIYFSEIEKNDLQKNYRNIRPLAKVKITSI